MSSIPAAAADRRSTRLLCLVAAAVGALLLSGHITLRAQSGCTPPLGNPIVCENQLAGAPASEWDISGSGDDSIQGFATDISVNRGGTVRFKVDTRAAAYRIDIYRLGYYSGFGARKVATVTPSVSLPQGQPACISDATTGLVDCGNWAVSASWAVPATATSGIYIGKLVRPDTGGASHMVFVVRDDTGQSDILLQTSDTTWQAYNDYGGNSLYSGAPAGRAYKVSYNRPFTTRGNQYKRTWLFADEYPMLRWLEANGYSVSYTTGVDTDRRGAELLEHRIFMSSGHDEYWSGPQRTNVEAARAAGVHLAFFSGNTVFWKTRWENSKDAANVPYRTLVTYKNTLANAWIDPSPNVWTGTWRDARFSPPGDGGRPENALTGTIFMGNCCGALPLTVSSDEGRLRFWRNTPLASLAAGTSATIAPGIVGYEFDADLDNGFRPSGLMRLSTSRFSYASVLLDEGGVYGPGQITHALTLYRHGSGALVFSSGTNRWSWALDNNHDEDSATPGILLSVDPTLQQATVNLLADMSVQPLTLQAGLSSSATSSDTLAPTSTITSPQPGTVPPSSAVVIAGTAADTGGGRVSAVEVSVDGGSTWKRASGLSNWTFNWGTGPAHTASLLSRAVDDSGNVGQPSPSVTVTVGGTVTCPCSIWPSYQVPGVAAHQEAAALELGVKFTTDTSGSIRGIRYFKSNQNTGVHTGSLWTASGTLLRSATFTSETASGWQQVYFDSPVSVTANTTYVASYHTNSGYYSADVNYFASGGFDNGPLHALSQGASGGNGLFRYGATAFPNQSFSATNYWVDVVFENSTVVDTTPPTVVSTVPATGRTDIGRSLPLSVTFSEAMGAGTVSNSTFQLRDSTNVLVPAVVTHVAGSNTATLQPSVILAPAAAYTATIKGGQNGVKDRSGNPLGADYTWSFTTTTQGYSIWPPTAAPTILNTNDATPVELGLKFRTAVNGYIGGIRFYKGTANTGVHTGSLWTLTGTLLSTVTFTNETASGWQQATLPAPVAVTANTTYVVSYRSPLGVYSATSGAFSSAGVINGPLEALSNTAAAGNGVYRYGPTGFPTDTFNSTNYFVDVVFDTSIGADTTAPTVTGRTPAPEATGVAVSTAVTATFSENVNVATLTGATFKLTGPGNTVVPAVVSYSTATNTATLQPNTALAIATTYTGRLIGGSAGITDNAGNALATDIVWSFATSTPSIIISNLSVPEGSSGTRSGSLVATLSAPSSSTVTVNYATANGTATSGSDYVAASGVLTFAPGTTSVAIPITVIGDTTSEADETVLVNLSGATNVTIADSQGVLTITNDDPQLTINNSSVTEPSSGSATATFTVTLTAPNAQTVTVGYATANGTATSGTDYTATSGTLTFSPGTTTRSINVTALGDLLDEANETFVVNLSNPVNAAIATAQGTGTIVDDDSPPSISIGDVSVTEGNTATRTASLNVTLSAASGRTVTVNYATANGTATAGSDYLARTGTLTFAPGVTSQPVVVTVNGDALSEANETVLVALSGATNASISDSQGVLSITNDDAVPSITIGDASITEGNSGTKTVTLTLKLSALSGRTVTVNYATAEGTASSSSDYASKSGTVTFSAGTASITVTINGDNTRESNETFLVNLSVPSNATLARTAATVTILNDD